MDAASLQLEFDCSPDELRSIILDFDAYERFIDDCKASRLVAHDPDATPPVWIVDYSIQVVRRVTYQLRFEEPAAGLLQWRLVEPGFLRRNEGRWKLEALDGGRRTRVDYAIAIETAIPVPARILHRIVEITLPKTMDAFVQEARRRFPQGRR